MDRIQLETPVLLLVYNRPEQTRQVLESLEAVRPRYLYVVADGAKDDQKDRERCQRTRELLNDVPWNCTITRLFRDHNLGVAKSVSTGITWFFEHTTEGIIIEDDCIADPSFFYYCEALLERYRNNESIFHIGGNNFQGGKLRGDGDYYFSIFTHVWGWATWRRAWVKYEHEIDPRETSGFGILPKNNAMKKYFRTQFEHTVGGKLDTWGFRWTFACWKNNGLSIVPNTNLVSNIGFGPDSTHTSQQDSPLSNMKRCRINLPPRVPSNITIDRKADYATYRLVFNPRKTLGHYIRVLKKRIKTVLDALNG